MEFEGSLPHLQEPATFPVTEPDNSGPCPLSHFLKIHFNIVLQCMPGSTKLTLSLRSPHQKPACTSVSHACHMPMYLIALNFITSILFGERYISLRSSLYSLLHFPVTSSVLGSISSAPYSRTSSAYIPQSLTFHTHTHTHIYIYICVCVICLQCVDIFS